MLNIGKISVVICIFILSILILTPSPARAGEVEIVQKWCKGEVEVPIVEPYNVSTRVDCIYDGVAYEADWAPKWAEAVGQATYYAERTGLRPGIVLITKSKDDARYIYRLYAALKMIPTTTNGTIKVVLIEERDYQ